MMFGKLKLSDDGKDDGGAVEVMIMLGRFHLYEGYTIDQVNLNSKQGQNKLMGLKVDPRLEVSQFLHVCNDTSLGCLLC